MWSRVGDDDLSDSTDITITTVVNTDMYIVTSYLIIRSTDRFRDQGVYNCTASNGVTNNIGAVNIQSAELIVQGNVLHIMPEPVTLLSCIVLLSNALNFHLSSNYAQLCPINYASK